MWRRLTNVWPLFAYWKQSDAIRQLTDIQFEGSSLRNLKTAHRQHSVSSSSKICLCMSITNKYCPLLKHFFQTYTSSSQNNPNWSTQRKYVVEILDHPGTSGGERV